MNTIIITLPASILTADAIGLALYASKLKPVVLESLYLASIKETMKINLN